MPRAGVRSPLHTATKPVRPTPRNATPSVRPSRGSGGVSARERPRILCVDDEPLVLRSLAAALRKHFEIVPANGAREALALLEREPGFRVVLSDYRMPGMDGGAFLALVRERFPMVIRMLLSGAGAESLALDDSDLVFRVLSKPCPRATLVQALEEALARSNVGVN